MRFGYIINKKIRHGAIVENIVTNLTESVCEV